MSDSKELKAKISRMEGILNDSRTSADVKNTLTKAVEEAKKRLKDLESAEAKEKAKPEKEATKKVEPKVEKAKKEAKSALERCRELLRQYEEKKESAEKRAEKRRKEGKPRELTPGEAVKKSAASVKSKVVDIKENDQFLKKSDINSLVSGIMATVQSTLSGIETAEEKGSFLSELIAKLESEKGKYGKARAERGMLF